MIFAALIVLAAFCGLFAWLIVIAFRTNKLLGLGWSVTKAEKPLRYWLGVASYLLSLTFGLMFFLIVMGTANIR